MLPASLYIILCSAKNRLRVRLRRLREPRYLFGAIAGIVYFYFAFFARMRATGRASRRGTRMSPDAAMAMIAGPAGAVAGLGFLILAALVWLLPMTSSLLDFTEAEVQFLFPAPMTRRELLVHRLLRSQLGLLFASFISAIAFPSASVPGRLRIAVSMWVILATMRVYATGVSLSRAKLATADVRARAVARAPLVLVLLGIGTVGFAVFTQWKAGPLGDAGEAFNRVHAAVSTGLPAAVLWPFTALAKPLFSPLGVPFATALAAALAVLAAVTAWVLASDQAFQDAADEDTRRRAEKRARAQVPVRFRAAGWTLPLRGRPEHVFLWKNAMQMLRATSGLTVLRFLVPLTAIAVMLITVFLRARQDSGAAVMLCVMAGAAGGFTTILGPQIIRLDLRDDLGNLDLLKTWPVRAAAVIRGEMMLPAFILTGVAWMAIVCSAIFSAAAFPQAPLITRASAALAAIIVSPALVFAQLSVHNAAAILFPAWVPAGNQRPRGLDQVGQRLIMLGAVLLTVALMMLPGLIIASVLWYAFYGFVGAVILVPGAAISLVIVAVEVLAATEALGPAYEHLDISSVERAET
jgi:hypothetical protein